jgi:cardiolipin synthase C
LDEIPPNLPPSATSSCPRLGTDNLLSGLSGVRLLPDGKDAFAARILLAREAKHSLDVQYYIWHDDLSGSLMLDELEAAADRGVMVRLLLDDNGIPGLDGRLASLAMHDCIEVKIYNPFKFRRPKWINWLISFRRLNHRMHSKSFTADTRITILGGRNIGDEYFGARSDGLFADIDVLAVGKVVSEVSAAFDRCWSSAFTCPIERIAAPVSNRRRLRLARKAATLSRSAKARRYREEVEGQPLYNQMATGELDLTWATVRLVENSPLNTAGSTSEHTRLEAILPRGLAKPEVQIDLISGYFVPTTAATRDLAVLAKSGVTVRALTNCFAATDVGLVHAGYAPYRRSLVEAGIELFEMPAPDDRPKTARKFVRPGSRFARSGLIPGSTLHAKAFAVDRKELYVGSANFDPRSAHLNTELGIVIESEEMANAISNLFDQEISSNSYRLGLDHDGRLNWTDTRDDNPVPSLVEPGTSIFSRAVISMLARLPIEWLL